MIRLVFSRKQIVQAACKYPDKAPFRADLDNLMYEDVRRLLGFDPSW